MAEEYDANAEAGDQVVAGADSGAHFEPLVRLEKIEVRTGEEDEDVVYKERAKLYRFDADSKLWKERGTGDVKLLAHKETKKVRLILRQEKTLKICMNHIVSPAMELKPNPGSDRAWTWTAEDWADGDKQVASFAIKFKNTDVANEFKSQYDSARKTNERLFAGGAISAPESKTAAPAGAGSPWDEILAKKQFDALTEDQLQAIWKKYDKDGSKSIDLAEFKHLIHDLMHAILKAIKVQPSDEVQQKLTAAIGPLADQAMAKLDKNKDGKLSWDEFLKLDTVKLASK